MSLLLSVKKRRNIYKKKRNVIVCLTSTKQFVWPTKDNHVTCLLAWQSQPIVSVFKQDFRQHVNSASGKWLCSLLLEEEEEWAWRWRGDYKWVHVSTRGRYMTYKIDFLFLKNANKWYILCFLLQLLFFCTLQRWEQSTLDQELQLGIVKDPKWLFK